jgi:5-(carboxyamino)imidazole ribonucleotide synthase
MVESKTSPAKPARTAPSAEHGQSFGPGATIGILGGGQLGRMAVLAAARLGLRCHI